MLPRVSVLMHCVQEECLSNLFNTKTHRVCSCFVLQCMLLQCMHVILKRVIVVLRYNTGPPHFTSQFPLSHSIPGTFTDSSAHRAILLWRTTSSHACPYLPLISWYLLAQSLAPSLVPLITGPLRSGGLPAHTPALLSTRFLAPST